MTGKFARLLFLLICLILAVLALTNVITPMGTAVAFAVALVLLGILSKGFRKQAAR